MKLNIVVFGLSITSSWGNGHATTYRALIKALARRGHDVTFIERDVPWYSAHRDLSDPGYCAVELYDGLVDAGRRFGRAIANADLVILGSYVPDGIVLGDWITSHARGVTAFYDIDTPVTLANLESPGVDYLSTSLIPRFDLYLSFTGGPTLREIESKYGSPRARPLYCGVDLDLHAPVTVPNAWAMGYLGTYSTDREPMLRRLLMEPARQNPNERFIIAGAQYPADLERPGNVGHIEHVAPTDHARFYAAQRYALNVTRADMIARGYSPSVRLFEAAACGTPVISDRWIGLETFFTPNKEILIAETAADVVSILRDISKERRQAIAAAARARVLKQHSAEHRAIELERYYLEVAGKTSGERPDVKEVVA